jgi:hypothetical protein
MMILIEVETESECACDGDKEVYIPACYSYNYREDPLGILLRLLRFDIYIRLQETQVILIR